MKWDEVQGIETDQTDDTIVFKGRGKQLAIPGTSFWSGKDKKRMKELYAKQIERRQITVKYNPSAIFCDFQRDEIKASLTKRVPDGWDSARFLGLVLSFGSFPFPSVFLPSRTPKGHNAGCWAEQRVE